MASRENNFTETYKCLVENKKRRAEKEANAIADAANKKNQFMKEYYSIKESREQARRRHGVLMESCRDNALGTAIKAIFITALESGTLTDNGIILAENLVDTWIKENGGAKKILTKCQNETYLLSRIAQIVEEAAILETEEIEDIENGNIEAEDDKKSEDKNSKKESEEEIDTDELDLATKVIAKKLNAGNDEAVRKALEIIASKYKDTFANDIEDSTKEEKQKKGEEEVAPEIKDDETSKDIKEDESVNKKEENKEDSKDDALNDTFDDEEEAAEEAEKSDDKKEESEEDKAKEETVEDKKEETEEVPEEESEEDKEAEESKDALNDTFDDEEEAAEEDVEAEESEEETEEVPEEESEEDKEAVSIDGEEESKGKVFDELEKEEDVVKAIKLIRNRVANAEETFIKRNAEDKKAIDKLIEKISDNVKTVEDIDNKDAKESKIAEESARLYKQKINTITENRPLTVMEKMTRNLHTNIVKEQAVREQYLTEDGNVDTGLIVESAKIMYGFLETLNTLQLEKVDAKYIQKVLSEMN